MFHPRQDISFTIFFKWCASSSTNHLYNHRLLDFFSSISTISLKNIYFQNAIILPFDWFRGKLLMDFTSVDLIITVCDGKFSPKANVDVLTKTRMIPARYNCSTLSRSLIDKPAWWKPMPCLTVSHNLLSSMLRKWHDVWRYETSEYFFIIELWLWGLPFWYYAFGTISIESARFCDQVSCFFYICTCMTKYLQRNYVTKFSEISQNRSESTTIFFSRSVPKSVS